MKMADGGFRPAYNVQFATDVASQVVVGVAVSTQGSDQPSLEPMVEQIATRYARLPAAYLVDGGFVGLAPFERLAARGARCDGLRAATHPARRPRSGRPAGDRQPSDRRLAGADAE